MNQFVKIAAVSAAVMIAVPMIALAEQSALSQAIRAEIMKDPRSANISKVQMDSMVASLAQTAQAQGVSEADITWRPATADGSVQEQGTCDFLCQINNIFGFGGDDYTIPLGLGITSALLILFISLMLHRHHKHGIEPTIESIHTHA